MDKSFFHWIFFVWFYLDLLSTVTKLQLGRDELAFLGQPWFYNTFHAYITSYLGPSRHVAEMPEPPLALSCEVSTMVHIQASLQTQLNSSLTRKPSLVRAVVLPTQRALTPPGDLVCSFSQSESEGRCQMCPNQMKTVCSQPISHLCPIPDSHKAMPELQNYRTSVLIWMTKWETVETSCFRNLEELGRKEFKCLLSPSRFSMSVFPEEISSFGRNLPSLSSFPWVRLRKKRNQGAIAPTLSSEKILPCYLWILFFSHSVIITL